MENTLVPIEHNGVRVITTELLAQVYETDTNNIKVNFNRNKEKFKPGIHYFLLQGDSLRAFKREVTESNLVAPNVNQLYLWTERGANRHCKILDTPKAWEQFDNLEETYFMVKEQRKAAIGGKTTKSSKTPEELAAADKRATAMLLNAKNRTASILQRLYDRAGTKPEYQAMALSDFYSKDGVHLPRMAFQDMKQTYDKGAIAEKLGVYSKASGGKTPHAQAIGAIISTLNLSEDERERLPYCNNGHDGVDYQYTESVVEKVWAWLEANNKPSPITVNGKNYAVIYRGGQK